MKKEFTEGEKVVYFRSVGNDKIDFIKIGKICNKKIYSLRDPYYCKDNLEKVYEMVTEDGQHYYNLKNYHFVGCYDGICAKEVATKVLNVELEKANNKLQELESYVILLEQMKKEVLLLDENKSNIENKPKVIVKK